MAETALAAVVALSALVAGCEEPLDFERRTRERGSFGEEVHTILHKDLLRSPDDGENRGFVFGNERARFIASVDQTMPDALLTPLDEVLIRMMPMYDSGLVPGLVRKVALVLDDAMADPAFLDALARLDRRPDYLMEPARNRFLAHVLGYQRLAEVNTLLADLLLAHDGVAGAGASESDATIQLLLSLATALRDAGVTGDPERFAVTLVDLLLTEDPAFMPESTFQVLTAVKIDARGLPKVAISELGDVPFPFVDDDGDGLADVNAENEFVTIGGEVIEGATPYGAPGADYAQLNRDANGLLFNPTLPGLAFDYVDLHRTALGYLLRDAADLAERDVPFDLMRAARTALGQPINLSDGDGAYRGFDPQGDLVAIARGLMFAADHDDLGAVLEGLTLLLREHPNDLAKVLRAIDKVSDISDAHPEGAFADDANLLDEMAPLLLELVETPGLLEAVLLAMDDPAARQTGPIIAKMMRRKKDKIVVAAGGAYDTCFRTCKDAHAIGTVERIQCIQACPNDEIFGPEVDRNAPESPTNVSLFQRTQALMWEATGQSYEVGIQQLVISGADFSQTAQGLGAVLIFDDLAESYLLSLTGDLHLADMVNPDTMNLAGPLGLTPSTVADVVLYINEHVLGLQMDADPTPDQVTRFFNINPLVSIEPQVQMTMNMAICRSGRLCADAHADTLYVVEASGMVDALYPLASAFTAHGKTDLLARMFAVVYSHYPGRGVTLTNAAGQPLPLVRSNIRSVEPTIIEVLEEGSLLDALADNGTVLADLRLSDGSPFLGPLEQLLVYVLTPDASLRTLKGEDYVNDPMNRRISPLSPLYLALTPLRALTDRLDANQPARDAWDRAVEALSDLMLDTEDDGSGGARFTRPGGPALAALVLDQVRARWEEETVAGTRSTWLREDVPADLADAISDRALAAGVELFEWIDKDPARIGLLHESTLHILEYGEVVNEQVLIAAYGLLSGALDEASNAAMAHVLAEAVDPRRTWNVEGFASTPLVLHGLLVLDETARADPQRVVLDVLTHGLETAPDATTPLGEVWDIIRQVNRAEPGSTADMTPADYQAVFGTVVEFLRDDKRGMERLYGFIEYAMYGQAGKPQ